MPQSLHGCIVAVLNNATSGRQDTAQTSFDTMLTDNDSTHTKLDTIESSLNTIITHVDGLETKLDTQNTDNNYTGAAASDSVSLTSADLDQEISVNAGKVVEVQAITIIGETTAQRQVTINILNNGTRYQVSVITVAAGVTIEWNNSSMFNTRADLHNMKLCSTAEIEFVANAVTATESIVCRLATIEVKT